jgi:hypothetical protein
MTEWEHTVVTIIEVPRIGSVRYCQNCSGEHARTVVGDAMHVELMVPCTHLQPVPAELVQRINELIAGVEVDLDEPLPIEDEAEPDVFRKITNQP